MRNVVHHRERNTKYRIVACYIHKNPKKIKLSSKKVKGQYLLLQRKELVESQCSREQGGFLCLFFFLKYFVQSGSKHLNEQNILAIKYFSSLSLYFK